MVNDLDILSADSSWNFARDMCKAYNGTLLNLHSKLEMDFVSEKLLLIAHNNNNNFVYIGT